MEKSNGCTSASNSNCCTTNATSHQYTVKKKIGTFLIGLAIIFAVSSAFSNANVAASIPPSIEDFDWLKTDKKVAYILLEGKDATKNTNLVATVKSVVDELNNTDGSAHFEIVAEENTQDFIQKTAIEKRPSVVVLGKGTAMTVLSESVSMVKLFKAYITATTPVKSCSASSSCSSSKKSACCSKKSQ